MNRRELLIKTGATAAALGVIPFPFGWTAHRTRKSQHILMFTRSQGYEHSVIKRGKNNELSLAENIVLELGRQHGFEVTCSKDGREFLPETISKYDAFLFETTEDLTKEGGDGNPPMPPEGKQALLKAIASGKGFVGCHCASDTFHSPGSRFKNQSTHEIDPYLRMLGGEFIKHGIQQKARIRVVDSAFPGAKGLTDFNLLEEWYALKNFSPDLHVILVQDTEGMVGFDYQRPAFPATWARKHEQGRVFYTSMGHREDVWKNPLFQGLLLGGLSWALGNVEADVTPNIQAAAPQASELPHPNEQDEGKWVQLFNGKDLTGWKTHPDDKATWEVKDGILIGTGPAGHLFSERGDYENFRYRVEANINDHGNSGQYFRAQYMKSFPQGYEAQINATHSDPIRTGSLYPAFNRSLPAEEKKKILVYEQLHKPDEWFTQEVIAEGNHIIIKVNDKTTVDFVDQNNTYMKGHFAIQQHDPKTVVRVRKIEVMELPPTKKE
jgi:type 1 glutamine amidotransferase